MKSCLTWGHGLSRSMRFNFFDLGDNGCLYLFELDDVDDDVSVIESDDEPIGVEDGERLRFRER